MKTLKRLSSFFLFMTSLLLSIQAAASPRKVKQKVVGIGAGTEGLINAYFAFKEAQKKSIPLRYTIYDKNAYFLDTFKTTHLTPDELLFSNMHSKSLLEIGKMNMDLWQKMYDEADDELKAILEDSHFNPCREPRAEKRKLHDGYRIDIMYDLPEAEYRAQEIQQKCERVGYKNCKILSPAEVIELDPFLKDFCMSHSKPDGHGGRKWASDSIALFRPGGSIDTGLFLPKFYNYLKKVMGTYTSQRGTPKDVFRIRFNKKPIALNYARHQDRIKGLSFEDGTRYNANAKYLFCGEASELVSKNHLSTTVVESSLRLDIDVPKRKLKKLANLNQCMEVHKGDSVTRWHARCEDNKIVLCVGNTKEFAKNNTLLQLNMANDVFPELISLALGYATTKGKNLDENDLRTLEDKNIITTVVNRHTFPLFGQLYNARNGLKMKNAFGMFSYAVAANSLPRKWKAKKYFRALERVQKTLKNKSRKEIENK